MGVQFHPCFLPQPDQHEKLTGSCHLDLQAVQGFCIRLQQPADDRQVLLSGPLALVALVVLKALFGVEGQHLDLSLSFEDGHEATASMPS